MQCSERQIKTGSYSWHFATQQNMEQRLQKMCLLLLMIVTCQTTQATFVQNTYREIKPEQRTTGIMGPEVTAESNIECCSRCLSSDKCRACKYKETGQGNCLLINQNSTDEEGQIFQRDENSTIFEKDFCAGGPCQNGAQCVNTGVTYKCDCLEGYHANHCEVRDNCMPNRCLHFGSCNDIWSTYTCSCPPSLIGAHCEFCYGDVDGNWTPPIGWNGSNPALYRSFDNKNDLIFMEGSEVKEISSIHLTHGKVNCALILNGTQSQWVDLGIHTDVCMTQPETCTAGGAIGLWVNPDDCQQNLCGVITTFSPQKSGSRILYYKSRDNLIVSDAFLPDGAYFSISHSVPAEWLHVVLNYIGPNNGQGIKLYINGEEVASDTTKISAVNSAGDGRIIIGKDQPHLNALYLSARFDEILFFNVELTPSQILSIYNEV